jgi:hypothetical protein
MIRNFVGHMPASSCWSIDYHCAVNWQCYIYVCQCNFRSCNRPVLPSLDVHRRQRDSTTICISTAEILERQWVGRHFVLKFAINTDIQAKIRSQFADWLRAWNSLKTWHTQCLSSTPNTWHTQCLSSTPNTWHTQCQFNPSQHLAHAVPIQSAQHRYTPLLFTSNNVQFQLEPNPPHFSANSKAADSLKCQEWPNDNYIYTDMRRLTTGIPSEKCVVRWFRRCANVKECTYTNLDSIAYYTPRLYGIAYCS